MQHKPTSPYRNALLVGSALGLIALSPSLAIAQKDTTNLPPIKITEPRLRTAHAKTAAAANRHPRSNKRSAANRHPAGSKPVVSAPQSIAASTITPNGDDTGPGGHPNAAIAPYRQPPVSSPLGDKSVLDTPQSVNFVPESLILNQQTKTVNDTLRFLPSVEVRDQQGLEVSRPQSRGFQSSIVANTRLDGLNIIGTTAIPAENLAGIQVLNGLAGALYGPESPSGVFNYVLKKPTDQPFFTYLESFDSHSTFTEQIDAGGRVGPDQKLGYRVNVVHGQGESYVSDSYANRTLGSLYLDYRLDNQTTISGLYSHYATDVIGLPGEIVFSTPNKKTGLQPALPSAPNPTTVGLGQPGAGSNLVTDTEMGKFKHTFDNNWTLDIGGLYQNAHRHLYGITDTLNDNFGNYSVIKNYTAVPHFNIFSNSAYLNGTVDILGYKNDISIGTNGFYNNQYSYRGAITSTLGTGNLAFPTVLPWQPVPANFGEYKSGDLFQQSIIVGDTFHFNEKWSLQAVFNESFLKGESFNVLEQKTSATGVNGAFSPTVSLMYKPISNLTLYATYANSTEEGDQAPSGATNANAFLAPYHDEMYEAGAKYAFNPNFIITLDGFRMTRPLAETSATTNLFSVVGTQQNWGAELFGQGAITPDLSLFGGVTYIDARLMNTGVASTNDMLVIGVPHWKGDLIADYHPAMWYGFALTGGVHFESSRAGNNTNTTFADPYATLDLGARYSTLVRGHRVTARFQVVNVTNTFYYSSIADGTNIVGANGGDTAFLGAPRTFQASLQVDF